MRSPRKALLVVGPAVGLGLTGCARHVYHHYPTAAVLDRQHYDAKIVVVHEKPAPRRHCWRHLGHWHCTR